MDAYGKPSLASPSYGSLTGEARPMPMSDTAGFMNQYNPPPSVVQQPQASPAPPMQNMASMAGIEQFAGGAEPPMPRNDQVAAYPKSGGIGPNGFGIHPETTQDDIVDYLLPKFQEVESSHDPTNYVGKKDHLPYKGGDTSASGLFGYVEKTWGNYKGYPRAMDAPPEVQIEKMKQDLKLSLARYGNDPYKAIANHYHPASASNPMSWSDPLKHDNGTPIIYKSGTRPQTVSEYARRVLQAGNDPAGHRFDKYFQGVNPHRQSTNNKAPL